MSTENNDKAVSPKRQQFVDLNGKWMGLSEEEKWILGRPNFTCGAIAERMRQMGHECERKAEEEQALVIFTMLEFHKEYGKDWVGKMNQYLKAETSANP
jgi:hypothetical protein